MPLIWISMAYFGGLVAADHLPGLLLPWYLICALSVIFLGGRVILPLWVNLAASWKPAITLVLVCAAAFSIAGIRYQHSLPDVSEPGHIIHYIDAPEAVVVTGVVRSFPAQRDHYLAVEVDAEKLRYVSEVRHLSVHGALLARLPPESEVEYGDRVALRGLLLTPPEMEGFSYRAYLVRQGIYAYMPRSSIGVLSSGKGKAVYRWTYAIKTAALDKVNILWPDPEASLLSGILLGEEGRIPASVEKAFQDTGTSHIIAISGFNITIVAGLMAALLGRWLKGMGGVLASIVGIGLYTILVGADPAVVRAAWMGGLALFARQIGRRSHGLNAAAVASLMMAWFNPHTPWDISFQLSLAATLGLLLYAEPLADGFLKLASRILSKAWAQKAVGPVSEYVLFTLAAQIVTFPVLIYHFQRFSWISFLANPAILPAQPPIMVLGGAALIAGMIWLPAGKVLSLVVYPFVSYTIRVVEFFSQQQGEVIHTAEISLFIVVLLYAMLVLLTFSGVWLREVRRILRPSLVVALLAIGNILVWRANFNRPDGQLYLTFLDVGTGSAVLVRSPTGRRALINGGPSSSALADGLGRRFSLLNRELDLLVVASPLAKDIAALPATVERNPPRQVIWLGAPSPSMAADDLRAALRAQNIDLKEGKPGMVIEIEEDLRLEILTRSERGGMLLLHYDRFRLLLPWGVTKPDLQSAGYGRRIGYVSLLMLADNGYHASNPIQWIRQLNPRLVVLSVAADDQDGRPSAGLLSEMAGYSLLRTDVHGAIEITTDGQQMWIHVDRLP